MGFFFWLGGMTIVDFNLYRVIHVRDYFPVEGKPSQVKIVSHRRLSKISLVILNIGPPGMSRVV